MQLGLYTNLELFIVTSTYIPVFDSHKYLDVYRPKDTITQNSKTDRRIYLQTYYKRLCNWVYTQIRKYLQLQVLTYMFVIVTSIWMFIDSRTKYIEFEDRNTYIFTDIITQTFTDRREQTSIGTSAEMLLEKSIRIIIDTSTLIFF